MLAEHWTELDGVEVFYRETPSPSDARVMMHLHGFAISGSYMLPTARMLTREFHTLVPDLPGFGRSGNATTALGVRELADAAAAFLVDRGIPRATLVGNSMGCPVICEFAFRHPDMLDHAILVSPAGGSANQPLPRAIGQLVRDSMREPLSLLRIAIPDYLRFGVPNTWRMFQALTHYPSEERLLSIPVPTLAVVGSRDPLLPPLPQIREVAEQFEPRNRVVLVVIDGAAHAINFSHPGELANVIRLFMADQPIVDDPHSPGHAHAYEIHRGRGAPPAGPEPGYPGARDRLARHDVDGNRRTRPDRP
ncbi:MAG: alpha/beta hydrolase [Microlunatus sp.]|nr:alpha/beta hydrolase [Microlunatus sp.]